MFTGNWNAKVELILLVERVPKAEVLEQPQLQMKAPISIHKKRGKKAFSLFPRFDQSAGYNPRRY
jgi:hypothetical protein